MRFNWYSQAILYCMSLTYAFLGAQDFIKIPQINMTQSEAHLSIPWIRQAVEDAYHINDNPFFQRLWLAVQAREKEFNDTHYVFYTAYANEWRLLQDLYLKLFERLHPLTMDLRNFRAFRWMDVKTKKPEEYVKEQMYKYGLVDDRQKAVKRYLLSTNLALFGNVGYFGECTFEYFLNLKEGRLKRLEPDVEGIKQILDIFGASRSYIRDIKRIADYLEGEEVLLYLGNRERVKWPQSIAQIFIPKYMVNEIAYLSWVIGIPYEPELIRFITRTNQKNPDFGKFKRNLEDIKEMFKDKKAEHMLFRQVIENIEQRKYAISPVLDAYKSHPAQVPDLNYLQARLVVDPYSWSIGSGIRVFDYDTISYANKIAYERELNRVVDKIVKERLIRAKKEAVRIETKQKMLDTLAKSMYQITISKKPSVRPAAA
jgi:hypothetical protein